MNDKILFMECIESLSHTLHGYIKTTGRLDGLVCAWSTFLAKFALDSVATLHLWIINQYGEYTFVVRDAVVSKGGILKVVVQKQLVPYYMRELHLRVMSQSSNYRYEFKIQSSKSSLACSVIECHGDSGESVHIYF